MTLSAEEAKALTLDAPQVSREAAHHVLEYLSWNKALIGENLADSERLEKYLNLVRNMREGVHVVISDPYERATALLFELVLSEEFDPWAIDLVRFTQLYLERTRVSGMDFPVAGRLLYMAWNILFLQSQVVLDSRKEPEAPEPDVDPRMDDGYLGVMGSPEELDATTAILTSPDPPFETMVRHTENRPVSLMELASAFHEAEQMARIALDAERARQRLREAQEATQHAVLVHGEEVPLGDMEELWKVALNHPIKERFPFTEVLEKVRSRERIVSLFLSLLFLVRAGGVEIHQKIIGKDDLLVVRLEKAMDPSCILIGTPIPTPGMNKPKLATSRRA